jgi:hypothetical protein
MRTNMRFPTVSPRLFEDPRFSERTPNFVRETHQLRLTLKPTPPTVNHRSGFVN